MSLLAQKRSDHSRQVDEFLVAVVTNHQEPSDSKQLYSVTVLEVRSPKSASAVMSQFGHVLLSPKVGPRFHIILFVVKMLRVRSRSEF